MVERRHTSVGAVATNVDASLAADVYGTLSGFSGDKPLPPTATPGKFPAKVLIPNFVYKLADSEFANDFEEHFIYTQDPLQVDDLVYVTNSRNRSFCFKLMRAEDWGNTRTMLTRFAVTYIAQ
jgi:hypothetical protein